MITLFTILKLFIPFIKDLLFCNEEVREEFRKNKSGLLNLMIGSLFTALIAVIGFELIAQKVINQGLVQERAVLVKEMTLMQEHYAAQIETSRALADGNISLLKRELESCMRDLQSPKKITYEVY